MANLNNSPLNSSFLNFLRPKYNILHLLKDTIFSLIAIGILIFISYIGITNSRKLFKPKTLASSDYIQDKRLNQKNGFLPLFNINHIREKTALVPRDFLKNIPDDLLNTNDSNFRKKSFISIMLPNILLANDLILKDRKELQNILNNRRTLKPLQILWIRKKLSEYKIKNNDLMELSRRMNIIPPSLALAQAAIESGWGTSRFARKGNALYGEWIWPKKGRTDRGITPTSREEGKNHQIKKFNSIFDAVNSYMKNLNIHRAYQMLRFSRAKNINGNMVDPMIDSLTAYSELGQEYVDLLHQIITKNKLRDFDHIKLRRK
jgi:Bax protein